MTERIGDEAFRRQRTAPPVATRQTFTADIEFAGDADRRQVEVVVENVQRGVADRAAEQRTVVLGIEAVAGRPHRGLGRAVQVPDFAGLRHQPPRQVRRQRLAAAQHAAACRQRWAVMIEQHPPGRRRRLDHGHAVLDHHGLQPGWIMRGRTIRQHHLRADSQRQPQLQHRDIKRQRGQAEHAVLDREARPLRHRRQKVRHRIMADHHALGQAGRA